uniref:Chemokine interleukin-8-like domain-containing protein n=1 Tax=Oryzias melastigma TaxID=30732 RepID=A0A3B3E187_ORYME
MQTLDLVLPFTWIFFCSFHFKCSEVLKDCCLSVSKNRVPAKFVVSYYIQEAGKGCNLSATVFETKGGRRLCIVHPDGFPWVQKVISIVDKYFFYKMCDTQNKGKSCKQLGLFIFTVNVLLLSSSPVKIPL